MSALDLVNFHLVPGVVLGSIYALGAIGVTLVFAIMRHGHLAHGDLSTLGAFIALFFVSTFGLSPFVSLPLAMIAAGLAAVLIDRLFYEHLRERAKIITTIATLGIALMLRSIVQVFWGVNTQFYSRGLNRPEDWFGIRIRTTELVTIGTAIGLVIVLQLFLTRSRWGKAMRAMSDNPDLALLSGIDNRRVVAIAWMIVGALCAASGFFLGLNTELRSLMGWNILLPVFAAAILGGAGRIEGAIVGGLIVGIVEEFSVLFIPSEYKVLPSFAILVLILVVRPTGLFRGKVL